MTKTIKEHLSWPSIAKGLAVVLVSIGGSSVTSGSSMLNERVAVTETRIEVTTATLTAICAQQRQMAKTLDSIVIILGRDRK